MESLRLSDITIRTFGWIQNPSDFSKLKKIVQLFDHTSSIHVDLKENRIPRLVEKDDGRDRFIEILNRIPLKIKYIDLVGTSFKPRSSGRCNGIAQAMIEGQGKSFTDNWTADGFIRWAHALGFIQYDYLEDEFSITQAGFDFSRSINDSEGENEILIEAMLSYPPAVRVLDLLSLGEHLTKFDIGKNLGFNGESGFTSLPLNIMLQTLADNDLVSEKTKIRQDWEGSSDKYSRMIAGWLSKLGLVKKEKKYFDVNIGGIIHREYISHAYKITGEGLKQLRRAKGTTSARRIEKRVCWEMFATKNLDRTYIRTRRAYILKFLEVSSSLITIEQIKTKLLEKGYDETVETIKSDIKGLINIGLNIQETTRGYSLKDSINDFMIPVTDLNQIVKSSIEMSKANMRDNLQMLPHDYIELIEISQDPYQNRIFEMKVMDLFINEYGFSGSHLGGSRKPDGAMYAHGFGVIVDTKAYKDGYNLPISQADEMERYVRENIDRNEHVNSNRWWNIFPEDTNEYKFLFVSGFFKGNFEKQLERISIDTGVQGGALSVEHLLLGAEYIKRGILTLYDFKNSFLNKEIQF
ncbi:restriction endonuclease FokI C-terminal domain-containing protein [Clostridium botulinum]|uniref:restriction endonuclease FokI C-terminal domain-containing protein n=1 Tax=Clostridium botulinum TaxID=1491 RepID=UPI001D20ABDB|nr:hypothetical protein [Clostridium botulinum]